MPAARGSQRVVPLRWRLTCGGAPNGPISFAFIGLCVALDRQVSILMSNTFSHLAEIQFQRARVLLVQDHVIVEAVSILLT